jgi:hypothetical protein
MLTFDIFVKIGANSIPPQKSKKPKKPAKSKVFASAPQWFCAINSERECQKSYTVDFLSKKQRVNNGEFPQYYVENSHPAIVTLADYELVQAEIKRREQLGSNIRPKLFSSRVICGECNSFYGPKVWHSKAKYRRVVWQCNRRYAKKGIKGCSTPHISEEGLKSAFVRAWGALLAGKERYIAKYEAELKSLANNNIFDKEMAILTAECAKLEALKKSKLEQKAHKEKILRFIGILNKADADDDSLADFDENLFRQTVEDIIVNSLDDIVVRFVSGAEVRVSSV